MRMEEVGVGGGGVGQYSGGLLGGPGGFEEHVKRLRGTMFYVCQVRVTQLFALRLNL